jgi:hypothetical protein
MGRAPRTEDTSHPGEHAFEVGGFLFQQGADVDTRRRPRAADVDDVPDFSKRQSKSPCLTDER